MSGYDRRDHLPSPESVRGDFGRTKWRCRECRGRITRVEKVVWDEGEPGVVLSAGYRVVSYWRHVPRRKGARK